MNAEEYQAFYQHSIEDYANDLMKSQDNTMEQAVKQAQQEFADMLPKGRITENNMLMMVEETDSSRTVGYIWYLYEVCEGAKQVFLNDFLIYEEQRRKGYATDALAGMLQNAREDGCMESITYVWKHNFPGIRLYTKCGYVVFRETEDGMYMKKEIIR